MSVTFDPPELVDGVATVDIDLLTGACSAITDLAADPLPAQVRAHGTYFRGGRGRTFPSVSSGRYALLGRGRNGTCGVVAAGCSDVRIRRGRSGVLAVTLRPAAGPDCPPERPCLDGVCGGVCGMESCDDGDPCTDDRCEGDRCLHDPNAGAACDDGVFCNGEDGCAAGECTDHGGDPCPGSSTCDEGMRACTGCGGDADCPGDVVGPFGSCLFEGDACDESGMRSRTVMRFDCVGGSCVASSSDLTEACSRMTAGLACDDGLFCNGPDACAAGACTMHAGNPCGAAACDEGARACACSGDPECEDGLFCNGTDSCSGGRCVHAGNPCTPMGCLESTDTCGGCTGDEDCEDGNVCSADICQVDGSCRHPAVRICTTLDCDPRCTPLVCLPTDVGGRCQCACRE